MNADLANMLQEQRAAVACIAAGGDCRGIRLWLADAVMEEILITAELEGQ